MQAICYSKRNCTLFRSRIFSSTASQTASGCRLRPRQPKRQHWLDGRLSIKVIPTRPGAITKHTHGSIGLGEPGDPCTCNCSRVMRF